MTAMDWENPVVWLVGGLILGALVIVFVAPRFSSEARMERRRRKSNAPIVNKSQRRTVRFNARTKDKK
jgi:uncharacterized membrane-anchored protein YhcB (DUF1043 family)